MGPITFGTPCSNVISTLQLKQTYKLLTNITIKLYINYITAILNVEVPLHNHTALQRSGECVADMETIILIE